VQLYFLADASVRSHSLFGLYVFVAKIVKLLLEGNELSALTSADVRLKNRPSFSDFLGTFLQNKSTIF